jgi:phosphosulfolactate phosphohydrolase-like enzyme
MPARRTVLIDAFPDSAFRHRERAAVVCIDVMLATTTLVTAAGQGRRTLVASNPDELRAVAQGLDGAIVAGHLAGAAPGVFTSPDGPCALLRQEGSDRPLVLASPPGTALIVNAAGSGGAVFLACFRNLSATASALAAHSRVALLAAGCREEFSCEDQMTAAWIAGRLVERGFEPEDRHTADIVRRWSGISPALAGWGNSAAALRREGRGDEVEFVLAHVDDVDRPCQCEGREVRLGAVAEPLTEGRRTRR